MTEHNITELRKQLDAANSRALEANRKRDEARKRLNDALIAQMIDDLEKNGTPVGSKVWVQVGSGRCAGFVGKPKCSDYRGVRPSILGVKKDGTASKKTNPSFWAVRIEDLTPYTEDGE